MLYSAIIKKYKHMMKFECIKGMVDSDNLNIIAMQGDQVIFNEANEGEVWVEGISGYCKGYELNLSPRQVVEHFKVVTE